MTGLAEIAVFTEDVAAVSAFYRGLLGDPVTEWPGGTLFAFGGAKLLVHERAAALDDGPPNEDHFALSVEDLDAACASLAAHGHTFLVEARTISGVDPPTFATRTTGSWSSRRA